MRNWLKKFFGSNMLSSEGEDHRRQRRIVAPAFSIPALSTITNTFYESAYKVKAHWDVLFESTPEVTIDVQEWMNRITLDSIGIAGFGHDFGSIDGQMSPVIEAFNAFGEADQGFAPHLMFILGAIFPQVLNIPIQRIRLFKKWNEVTSKIGEELFINSRREKQGSSNMKDRSIIGLLVKGESTDADLKLSREEVVAHIVSGLTHF
ncbi:hypothetical protein APHAL10511_001470 [Amanita phalloides]|nr:hypothetical protein APHAL10511_001470 [Amanita phalloides]